MPRRSVESCLRQPVIPMVWEPGQQGAHIGRASAVFLQGGTVAELPRILDRFQEPESAQVALFAHIDLIAGLENSEAGMEYLAGFRRLAGIVTVHHHLAGPAHKVGLLSIVRLFISDSRAVERGIVVANKSQADAIEILPAAAAVKVAAEFKQCALPRIAGGLCRTEAGFREALDSGCHVVASTRSALWQLNP